MKKSDVFRDSSLEQLSSPERLDEIMYVTTPKSWLALGGVGVLLITVVVWGFVGKVPTKVQGKGILLRSEGISEVVAPSRGQITDIAVRTGDVIEAGQVVARISQPRLEVELQQAQVGLEKLKAQSTKVRKLSEREKRLRTENLKEKRKNIQKKIKAKVNQIRWLEEKVESRRELLDQGLVTEQTLIQTKQKLRRVKQDTARLHTRSQQVKAERLALKTETRKAVTTQTYKIKEQKRRIENLKKKIKRRSRIVSPSKGRVLAVKVEQGDVVRKGKGVVTFNPLGRDVGGLQSVLYLTAQGAKKVETGMRVQVAPATVLPEEHGRVVGTVTYVSEFPATKEGIAKTIENEQLARSLMSGGAPYEVRAQLTLDPSTPSNYKWTSSEGPDRRLRSGTLCKGAINLADRRPVELILPGLRKATGL